MKTGPVEFLARVYQQSRRDLTAYVTRMVVRPAVADELVQEAALRLVGSPNPPTDEAGARKWLFRAATNLAIDHLRRHSTWRENILVDTRALAVKDEPFVAESRPPVRVTRDERHRARAPGCVLCL